MPPESILAAPHFVPPQHSEPTAAANRRRSLTGRTRDRVAARSISRFSSAPPLLLE
jgi:hypothetical protein